MSVVEQSPREKEVIEQLVEILKSIRKENLHKKCGPPAPPECDVTEMCLKIITGEVTELEQNVNSYNQNGHFTKEYRKLQGECSKLLADLDDLKLAGRENIRKDRKSLLMRIEAAADKLAGKTHENGKPCGDCEVGP